MGILRKGLPGYLFICLLLLAGCGAPPRQPPKVVKGVLDLSGWDLEKDGALVLDGDWEFYWQKFYFPADFKKDTLPAITAYHYVPGYWSEQVKDTVSRPGSGYATYRMKVKTNYAGDLLGLKLLDASSSYRFYINAQLIASNGITAANPDSMKSEFHPMVRNFRNDSDELEMILHVSNNFHSKGGPWSSFTLGTEEQVLRFRDRNTVSDMFLIGAMFILFIYHVWIFLFRKSEKAVIWFGLVCLAALLRSLVTNERFIFLLIPEFDPGVALRIEYLTICMTWLSWGFLLHHLFPRELTRTVLRVIAGITAVFSAGILFTPHSFYTSKLNWIQVVIILVGVYYCFISVIAWRRKRHGGSWLFASIMVMFVCVMNDILYARLIINTTFILPYGFFISLLAQAYILASRISYAFTTVELLSINLEHKVVERTFQLQEEKQKSDDLLLNILPLEIAEELKQNGMSPARNYSHVTVLFTDFVNFTGISQQMTPAELIEEIHKNFTAFDAIMEKHDVEKIKTIGDAYMAVCGLPIEKEDHAERVVKAALDIQAFMNRPDSKFRIRIGIHSGPVVAGIVGVKKFAYDIWGDTVNTAARMEQNSEVGKINISGATFELVKDRFDFENRGQIPAKNKGFVEMYFVGTRELPVV